MTHTKINTDDVEQVSDAMHFLKEPLECRQVGVTMARCEPGWKGKPHDHTDDGHEEVYILISGAATVRIDDEDIEMESGDAVWIPPEATRQIRNADTESSFVLVSAPEAAGDATEGRSQWIPDGVQG
jgi:quercetin dioxygenase-like cupin family protein